MSNKDHQLSRANLVGRCDNEIPILRAGNKVNKTSEAEAIVAAAKERLRNRSHLTVQQIWCEFDEGRLFVRGRVPSFYYKQLAQEAVAGLKGVCQVINEIEVVW
jgi:osmotically-inducible protein OsmY